MHPPAWACVAYLQHLDWLYWDCSWSLTTQSPSFLIFSCWDRECCLHSTHNETLLKGRLSGSQHPKVYPAILNSVWLSLWTQDFHLRIFPHNSRVLINMIRGPNPNPNNMDRRHKNPKPGRNPSSSLLIYVLRVTLGRPGQHPSLLRSGYHPCPTGNSLINIHLEWGALLLTGSPNEITPKWIRTIGVNF